MLNNKILVIDDEQPMVHSIYRTILLEDNSYEIISANNGKKGLELFHSENPVLVILDLKMPVMGGIEFLENIHLTPSDPCSVIVLTGYGSDENIKKCFDLGISAFLRKPFQKYEFIGLVRHTIALKETQLKLIQECSRQQSLTAEEKAQSSAQIFTAMKSYLIPIVENAEMLSDNELQSDIEAHEKLRTIERSAKELMELVDTVSASVCKLTDSPLLKT